MNASMNLVIIAVHVMHGEALRVTGPLVLALTNGWANRRIAGDFRRGDAHSDVTAMDYEPVMTCYQFDPFEQTSTRF